MDKEFLENLKQVSYRECKQGKVVWEEYTEIVQRFRGMIRKAKVWAEINLAKDIKSKKKRVLYVCQEPKTDSGKYPERSFQEGYRIWKICLPRTWKRHLDSRTECTLSKFSNDTNLYDVINTLEGRDAVQMDLDRFER